MHIRAHAPVTPSAKGRPSRQCCRSARLIARFAPTPMLVCSYQLQGLELRGHSRVRALSRPEGLGKGSSSPDNVALDYIDRKVETGLGWSTETCGFSSQASRFSGGWLTPLSPSYEP